MKGVILLGCLLLLLAITVESRRKIKRRCSRLCRFPHINRSCKCSGCCVAYGYTSGTCYHGLCVCYSFRLPIAHPLPLGGAHGAAHPLPLGGAHGATHPFPLGGAHDTAHPVPLGGAHSAGLSTGVGSSSALSNAAFHLPTAQPVQLGGAQGIGLSTGFGASSLLSNVGLIPGNTGINAVPFGGVQSRGLSSGIGASSLLSSVNLIPRNTGINTVPLLIQPVIALKQPMIGLGLGQLPLGIGQGLSVSGIRQLSLRGAALGHSGFLPGQGSGVGGITQVLGPVSGSGTGIGSSGIGIGEGGGPLSRPDIGLGQAGGAFGGLTGPGGAGSRDPGRGLGAGVGGLSGGVRGSGQSEVVGNFGDFIHSGRSFGAGDGGLSLGTGGSGPGPSAGIGHYPGGIGNPGLSSGPNIDLSSADQGFRGSDSEVGPSSVPGAGVSGVAEPSSGDSPEGNNGPSPLDDRSRSVGDQGSSDGDQPPSPGSGPVLNNFFGSFPSSNIGGQFGRASVTGFGSGLPGQGLHQRGGGVARIPQYLGTFQKYYIPGGLGRTKIII